HGAIMLVLECVPAELAKIISESLTIPTIGIGAGVDCNGQVLVYHDILQYGVDRLPKFVKTYGNFNENGATALKSYVTDVKEKKFRLKEHCNFKKDPSNLQKK